MANCRVLLVDDEQDYVDLLSQRLETRECDVLAAYDADSALKILKENEIDVVVLDVVMPGKDGIAALREIKADHPLVEVIMLTGEGYLEAAIGGMQLGAFDFQFKPAETEELLVKIRAAHALKLQHEDRIKNAATLNVLEHKGW